MPKSIISEWHSKACHSSVPLQMTLELTYKCNQHCPHCYLPSQKKETSKILGAKDWHLILDKIKEAGTLYLIFLGGEAMLHPDFFSILQYAGKKSFHNSLVTNGLKLDSPEICRKLKQAGIHVVTFSIYSLQEQIHDRMTKTKGSLKKALNAIAACQKENIAIGINVLLCRNNIKEYFSMIDWCNENDFSMNADPIMTCQIDGCTDTTTQRPSPEQIQWYFEEKSKHFPNSVSPFVIKNEDYVCNTARAKAAIDSQGNLIPCVEIRQSLGNLLHGDFNTIWQGPQAREWRQLTIGKLHGCPKELLPFMDVCPGMGLNECGDFLTIPPYVLEVAEIKKQVYEKQR